MLPLRTACQKIVTTDSPDPGDELKVARGECPLCSSWHSDA